MTGPATTLSGYGAAELATWLRDSTGNQEWHQQILAELADRDRKSGLLAVREPGTALAVPERIDGDQLLRETRKFLRHFAHWPSEAALTAATIQVAVNHAKDRKTGQPVWQYMPRFFITAAEGGSGKSWIGRLMAKLSPNGKMLVDFTKPSLIELIGQQATMLITEANINLPANRKLIGTLNAGYEPDQTATRKDHGKVIEVPLMGPVILDGLDSLLTSRDSDMRTLMSRCIVVRVKKAPPVVADGRAMAYRPPRFNTTARAIAERGSQRLARWLAQEVEDGLADLEPEVPDWLGNRPFALWEPHFAVAERAGGDWPMLVERACVQLETALSLPDADPGADTDLDREMESWGEDL